MHPSRSEEAHMAAKTRKREAMAPAEPGAVTTEKSGAVTTVILSRPARRNAIDRPTARALADAFRAFEKDREARVAVLWGAGGTFCAGADLKAIAEGKSQLPRTYGDGPMGPTRMRLAKPVIAAISGYAVAGGLEVALWCDVRVVEEDAVMGVFNRRWGIPLVDGGTVRLPAIVGLGRALDLMFTGRPVDAREALAIGLANRVVPRGRARAEAETLARTIAGFPPRAVLTDRESAYDAQGLPLAKALQHEFKLALKWATMGERFEGAKRFAAGAGRHGQF
jgi:enoyl-CoA hydratase